MRCAKPFKKKGVEFGCGQCKCCRIDRARLWTSRILLESRLHDHNVFVTLTYSPDSLPPGGTLVKRHLQLFLKLLRKKMAPRKIRFFAVGEYGDESGRPHYHACLFGVSRFDEPDLRESWPHGFVHVDDLTEGTAGYVSQYVVKKWTNGDDLYVSDRLRGRAPEFATMSLRPGVGAGAAEIVAKAIERREVDIPSRLRMDGQMRPLGRYIKRKITEHFAHADKIQAYEKQVWLRSVSEEKVKEIEAAKAEGKTPELYRWEKRRQRFLNAVGKHRIHKGRRTL